MLTSFPTSSLPRRRVPTLPTLLLAAGALGAACSAPSAEDDVLSAGAATVDADHLRPVACASSERDADGDCSSAWVGRLHLPTDARGQPDPKLHAAGDVFFEVLAAPRDRGAYVGKKLVLHLDAAWAQRLRIDVRFSADARERLRAGDTLPVRLDGWHGVTPLESLAASRATDDLEVTLRDAKLDTAGDGRLVIHEEPAQVEGTHVALVQIASRTPTELKVRLFNARTQRFETTATFAMDPIERSPAADLASANLDGIERSRSNQEGYFAYGDLEADPRRPGKTRMRVRALEPRVLLGAPDAATERHVVKDGGRDFLANENWKTERRSVGLASVGVMATDTTWRSELAGPNTPRATYHRGDRALLLHSFGWRANVGKMLPPISSGHFAFGEATVVPDPFTPSKLRFDVEYHQVYGRNPENVVAGTQKWHAYMGSFARGWMYQLPVVDAIVKLPALSEPVNVAGQRLDALAGLREELQTMMARYRTGDGTGVSLVTAATSCSQDSAQALFRTLGRFDALARDPRVAAWRRSASAADQAHFDTLAALGDRLSGFLDGFGPLDPSEWTADVRSSMDQHARMTPFGSIVEGLKAANTVLPRRMFDGITAHLVSSGATVFLVHSTQVGGGFRSQLEPIPPSTGLVWPPRRAVGP